MNSAALQGYLRVEGFENIRLMQFKRGPLRKAFRQAGQAVAKEARKKINARFRGHPGRYPLKRTGRLARSVRVRVSRPGLLVKVYHEKLSDQRDFYAAYLHYGTSRGVKARDNWIADALAERQSAIQSSLRHALDEALR